MLIITPAVMLCINPLCSKKLEAIKTKKRSNNEYIKIITGFPKLKSNPKIPPRIPIMLNPIKIQVIVPDL
jgi:hypothetical protein